MLLIESCDEWQDYLESSFHIMYTNSPLSIAIPFFFSLVVAVVDRFLLTLLIVPSYLSTGLFQCCLSVL